MYAFGACYRHGNKVRPAGLRVSSVIAREFTQHQTINIRIVSTIAQLVGLCDYLIVI